MSTETIASSVVTEPSYPCTCRPGCGQAMGHPRGIEAHGWALACYKRWQRAGEATGATAPRQAARGVGQPRTPAPVTGATSGSPPPRTCPPSWRGAPARTGLRPSWA